MFGWYQNCFYLCNRFSEVKYSGCSAVRLAHLLWEQGVVGSNPATPTDESQGVTVKCSSFFYSPNGAVYLWFKPKVQLNRELNQELVSPLIASKLLITGVE